MSQSRLQVLLDEAEIRKFRRAARRAGLTLSEWARRAMRAAERERSPKDAATKIEAVRAALGNEFPAPDIDEMLAEIESGYGSGE